jgi:putative transposase
MALDQSALLELLEALKAAEVDDRLRAATETLYQALIEAERTAVIGAAPMSAPRAAPRSATAPAPI